MARITKTRKPQALPETLLESLMLDHLRTLAVQNYSVHTVRNRQVHIGFFLQWCKERGLSEPVEITRPVWSGISGISSTTGRRTASR
jgi:hypothetical protein